jgi:hypothetical protein
VASEITYTAALAFISGDLQNSLQVDLGDSSPSGLSSVKFSQLIAVTDTAIKLGDITTPGYALFVNRDTVNFVDLKVAAAGAIFARLEADEDGDGHGGVALLKLGSGAQVPVAIANTLPCVIEVLIIKA